MTTELNPVPSETDETTPLLSDALQGDSPRARRTPLPWLQLGIVMVMQIVEPLMSQSIYPYINQLILDLGISGGDPKKVGFYAGLLVSRSRFCVIC